MRDLWISLGWLAAAIAIVAAFLVLDRWHQRRAWRQADLRAREILKSESVVGFVDNPRRRTRR